MGKEKYVYGDRDKESLINDICTYRIMGHYRSNRYNWGIHLEKFEPLFYLFRAVQFFGTKLGLCKRNVYQLCEIGKQYDDLVMEEMQLNFSLPNS